MTKQDLIELSKHAAEVLGVPARNEVYSHTEVVNGVPQFDSLWLAEDAGRCAEIAADRRISIYQSSDVLVSAACIWQGKPSFKVDVLLADHNNERIKAYCVSVCKAVILTKQ